MRSNANARRTKSKARLENYEKLQSETVKEKEAKLEIYIPNGQRLGDKVIEFKGVSKAFGDRVLFEDLSFALPPAGIVGIIGPNGAGKTTLFRMVMGEEKPDSGTITLGDTVQLAYVDQSHKDLVPEKTVYQVLSNAPGEYGHWRHLGEQPRLPGPLQLHRSGPEQESRRAVRWRAQPPAPGHDPEARQQRAAA